MREAPRAGGPAARRRRRPLAAAALFALAACADLRAIERDACGNGVVEAGEDCDRFAGAEGARCRPPSEAGACRYECAPAGGGGPRCPGGYGCGVDGTCRRASGAFAPDVERAPEAASALRLADFDGDGRCDVLALGAPNGRGERSARVVFRDEGGFGAARRVPDVFRSVAVGPLGAGPAQGLALVSDQSSLVGLELLVGGPDRTFASLVNPVLGGADQPTPSSARLVPVDALPERLEPGEGGVQSAFNQGDEVVLLLPSLAGAGAALYAFVSSPAELPASASAGGRSVVPLLTLGVAVEGSAGGVVVGRFGAPGASCEDIVWAPPELGEAYVLPACRPEPAGEGGAARVVWNVEGAAGRVEPRRIALPDGARPARGVSRWAFAADVDGDGASDLALATDRGVYVAYGRPDGSAPVAEPAGLGAGTALLAFADLNGDRAADWVLGDSIVLSEPGAPVGVERVSAPAPWSEALVGDFNGDGRPDVMAVGPASSSLDYYLGGGGGLFNPVGVPVAGAASRLAAGDFDGDSVLDVAFALSEGGAAATAGADVVSIAFGGPTFSAPLRVGELRGIRQIVASSYAFGGAELDGADDLGLVGAPAAPGAAQVSLLFGNAERQPRSPLLIATDSSLRPWAVAAGRFVAGGADAPAPLGLALLAGSRLEPGRPYSLWLSTPSGQSVTLFPAPAGALELGPGGPPTTLPPGVAPAPRHDGPASQAAGELPELLAGDLDGDGVDEAVALVPEPGGGASLVVARASGAAPMLFADAVVGGLPRSTLAGLVDADGDGARDLVVLSPAGGGGPNLAVYWNDAGRFDPAAFAPVALPGGPAASWAAAGGPGAARLFAVGAAGVYAVGFGAGRGAAVAPIAGLEGGESIAAGDVTGDGVVDLVVGDGRSLRLARGEAVRP